MVEEIVTQEVPKKKHKQRFIVLAKVGNEWVRSISFPKPYYVKAEAEAAVAALASNGITYKIRTK